MAKKPKKQKFNNDEGFIRGKRALLIGIFPVLIFLGMMAFGSWVLVDYYNKVTVNEDDSDACRLVRKHYPSSIKANYPCDITDKGTYWLVNFSQNTGTMSAPVYLSFKVNKSDNSIGPAVDVK